ncbi:hypothetical protein Metme_1378 [Methylomonas methanica MC09]|uniref:Uncharacterized protein n=2 Tax=Methylomonas methanica TaxID=421 RepID=F9ZY71_METMM|nr:hypothetical protein Metme_1378 [Methylomonas methanica MC09]
MFSVFASRRNHKNFLKAAMLLILAAGFPSLSMARPTEARLSALTHCQFVSKVEGWSGYGKHYDWHRQAKSSALGRAEKLGGSHIVWERMIPVGVFNGYAVARVYSCGS